MLYKYDSRHAEKVQQAMRQLGFGSALAEELVASHELKLEAEARSHDAWVLGKLLRRLCEVEEPKLVALSMIVVLSGYQKLFAGSRLLIGVDAIASHYGVSKADLMQEISLSAHFLERPVPNL
jgi:hypothetical protein